MKKLKFLSSKKGVISLYGVVVALIACIMLCGYLDLTQTTHVVEEIQSIMDITALSTLQGSLDSEGVRFDRLTIRDYEHFVPNSATSKSPAENQAVSSETNKDVLLEQLKADGTLGETTIWIDGTNADNVNKEKVRSIILKNFDYYLSKLLYKDANDPLFEYGAEHGTTKTYESNSIIKKYEIREFDAGLMYSSWGVDAEAKDGNYQKIPQAYLDTTIVLYLSVEPTFSSMNVSVEESHVYNALTSANSSSKLHVEGYTDDGYLVVSIRTLARMTVQGFIASDDTPDVSDLTISYENLPFTDEKYFVITDGGVVTGFSEEYYALPQNERPKSIKMPLTIRGITPIAIGANAFDNSEDEIVLMIIPETIKTIEKEAFKGANYLKSFGFLGQSQLTTIGNSAFSGCTSLLSFNCPNGVKEIPTCAFKDCGSLASFKYPSALEKIGDSAFENCQRLKGKLNLPDTVTGIGNKAYFACSLISEIHVPKSLVTLGDAAFGKMTSVFGVEVGTPNGKFTVSDQVLYQKEADGSYALILYPAEKKNVTYTIPKISGKIVTRIGDYAFYGNKYLDTLSYISDVAGESIDMLHGIQIVGSHAFEKCISLKTLQFAGDLTTASGSVVRKGLKTIGEDAFVQTPALDLIYIDKLKNTVTGSPWGANTNITTIRWKADDIFDWSKVYRYNQDGVILGLTDFGAQQVVEENLSLIIPHKLTDPLWGDITITAIGDNAFSCRSEDSIYCTANSKISQIEFAANVTNIGDNAFRGTHMVNFTLPSSVISIGNNAFADSALVGFIFNEANLTLGNEVFSNSALKNIRIPVNVLSIGTGTFKNCKMLETIELLTYWTAIPADTFNGCERLTNIAIPESVTGIGNYAFANCSVLTGINTKNIVNVGSYAFTNCSNLSELYFGPSIRTIAENAFINTGKLLQVKLDVEEDFVAHAPWGAASFTEIIWLNSKWVKYYEYSGNATSGWKIIGLSTIGKKALNNGELTAFQTPPERKVGNVTAPIISIDFEDADSKAALKKMTSMILNVYPDSNFVIEEGAFENATSLKKISMSSGVTQIKKNAFKNCTALTTFATPGSTTEVGESALEGCINLTSATLGINVKVVSANLFKNCSKLNNLVLAGSVTSIGANAFENCIALPTFHIKSSVSSIGNYAFQGCTALKTVTSDSTVLSAFNVGVFKNCTALTSVALPSGVTKIDNEAFYNCTSLSNISIVHSSALTTIGTSAFENTTSLKQLPTLSNLTTINAKAFKKSGLTTLTGQTSLTTIGEFAFNECASLTSVNSSALVTVGNSAFKTCTALTSFNGQKVTTIGSSAFEGCTKLTNVAENNTLTTVGSKAFNGCTALTTIRFGTAITSIASDAFTSTGKITDIHINRPEYNGIQTNTSRKPTVAGKPWSATNTASATKVHWANTLKVNGISVSKGTTATITYDNILLNVDKTAKTGTISYEYTGNVADLTITPIENTASNNSVFKNGTTIQYSVRTSTGSGYNKWKISNGEGLVAQVEIDTDNQISISKSSVSLNVPLSGSVPSDTFTIQYSGELSDLTLSGSLKGDDYKASSVSSSGVVTITAKRRLSCDDVLAVIGKDCNSRNVNVAVRHSIDVSTKDGASTTVNYDTHVTLQLSYSGSIYDLHNLSGSIANTWKINSTEGHLTPQPNSDIEELTELCIHVTGSGTVKVTDSYASDTISITWNDWFSVPNDWKTIQYTLTESDKHIPSLSIPITDVPTYHGLYNKASRFTVQGYDNGVFNNNMGYYNGTSGSVIVGGNTDRPLTFYILRNPVDGRGQLVSPTITIDIIS